ncbi:MAG: hypothetical protein GY719_32420 [bacterium]|nr:hypothetical protein [bacterium]
MHWEDTHRQLLAALRAEVRKSWGRVGEIEERLGCSGGYLSKLCSGRNEFRLDLFLKSIDALGLDPATFFSKALEIRPGIEDYLEQLENPGESDRLFSRMSAATLELEATEPTEAHRGAVAGQSDVADFATRPRAEQLRRLRKTLRYRTHAFTAAYLRHLDSLRYDDPTAAAKLATEVATSLIPALPGPRSDRLSLQCRALGVFGSARRLKGAFTAAAQAMRLALELSRRHQLREQTARTLQRASYLLKDFGHFERALACLREALEIYVDLDCRSGIGKTMVDRGMMLSWIGDHDTALLVLRQALRYLDGDTAELRRNRFAAHQYLAYTHSQQGDLDAAERQLETAAGMEDLEHGFYWGKLRWLQGTLAFKRGDFQRSEELFRSAAQVLEAQEPGQAALVSLDLVEALLAQDRLTEACELAQNMARLLERFGKNRLAEMAILQLVRAGLEGRVNRRLLQEARAQLEEGHARGASRDSAF